MSVRGLKRRVYTHRRWLIPAFSFAFTILTLYFVFRGIDKQIFARLVATQDRGLIGAAALFTLLQIILGGERWRVILLSLSRSRSLSILSVQAVFYAGVFFNCLPLGNLGGDIVRVLLARTFALSITQLVVSILIDRILVTGALIVLALATLPFVASAWATTAWFGCGLITLIGVAAFLLLQPLEHLLGRRRSFRLMDSVLRMTVELRYFARSGGFSGMLWALASVACGALAAYFIARSLAIGVGPLAMIAVMCIVIFVSALPISLAGWGVREVSLVALLGPLGVARETALLLSVEFGIIATLMSLPGGVIWLLLRQLHPASASQE